MRHATAIDGTERCLTTGKRRHRPRRRRRAGRPPEGRPRPGPIEEGPVNSRLRRIGRSVYFLMGVIATILSIVPLYGVLFVRPSLYHPELDPDEQFRFPFVIAN